MKEKPQRTGNAVNTFVLDSQFVTAVVRAAEAHKVILARGREVHALQGIPEVLWVSALHLRRSNQDHWSLLLVLSI